MKSLWTILAVLLAAAHASAQAKHEFRVWEPSRTRDLRYFRFEIDKKLTDFEYMPNPRNLRSIPSPSYQRFVQMNQGVPIYHTEVVEEYDEVTGEFIRSFGQLAFVPEGTNVTPTHSELDIKMAADMISINTAGYHSPVDFVALFLYTDHEKNGPNKEFELIWYVMNQARVDYLIKDRDLILREVGYRGGCQPIYFHNNPVFKLLGTSLLDLKSPSHLERNEVFEQMKNPPNSTDEDLIPAAPVNFPEEINKSIIYGTGLGWDGLAKTFPIKKLYQGFDFNAIMKSEEDQIGIFNYNRMPAEVSGLCGTMLLSRAFYYESNCALSSLDSDLWAITNSRPSSVDWRDTDKTSVDHISQLRAVRQLYQSDTPLMSITPFLSGSLYSILNVPNVAGQYTVKVMNQVGIPIGGNMSFGNENGARWAADLNVIAHEMFHGVQDAIEPTVGNRFNRWVFSIFEATSDIFSSISEKHLSPTTNRLKIMEGLSSAGVHARNIDKPYLNSYPTQEPNSYADHYCNRLDMTEEDYLYKNASILTQCYYLLASGTAHPRANLYSGPVPMALGENAAARLFLNAVMTMNPTDDYDFFDFKSHMLATLPANLLPRKPDIEKAWQAVGIFERPIPWVLSEPQTIVGPFRAGQRLYLELRFKDWYPGTPDPRIPGWLRLSLNSPSGKLNLSKSWRSWPYIPETSTLFQGSADVIWMSGKLRPEHLYFFVDISQDCPEISLDGSYTIVPPETQTPGGPAARPSGQRNDGVPFETPNTPRRTLGSTAPDTLHLVQLTGGTGNADLYLSSDDLPTPNFHHYAATGPGNEHQIRIPGLSGEGFWITVWGAEAFQSPALTYQTLPCNAAAAGLAWRTVNSCFPNANQMPTHVGNLVRYLKNDCGCLL